METVRLTLHIRTLKQLTDAIELAECIDVKYDLSTKPAAPNGQSVLPPQPAETPQPPTTTRTKKRRRKRRKPRMTIYSKPSLIVELDVDCAKRHLQQGDAVHADDVQRMLDNPYPRMARSELCKVLADRAGIEGPAWYSQYPKIITRWLELGVLRPCDSIYTAKLSQEQ